MAPNFRFGSAPAHSGDAWVCPVFPEADLRCAVWRRLGIATTGHSREDKTAGPAPASIADELGGADGAAEIGPAACAPVIDKAGGANERLEALSLANRRERNEQFKGASRLAFSRACGLKVLGVNARCGTLRPSHRRSLRAVHLNELGLGRPSRQREQGRTLGDSLEPHLLSHRRFLCFLGDLSFSCFYICVPPWNVGYHSLLVTTKEISLRRRFWWAPARGLDGGGSVWPVDEGDISTAPRLIGAVAYRFSGISAR
jgi:hypothetical protein